MKKLISTLPLFFIVVFAVSACGASATPTTLAVDVQNTVAVAASTATSIPPTKAPTQLPASTETPSVMATGTSTQTPTLEVPFTTTVAATSGGNSDCIKPLQGLAGGKPTKIKIENRSGFPITLSLFLNKNAFGDCGYRGYALSKGGSILINDLIQGCYNVSAVINNPKKPVSAFGSGCINNPDKWSIIILKDSVSLQGL
jgi:hypothetical protein